MTEDDAGARASIADAMTDRDVTTEPTVADAMTDHDVTAEPAAGGRTRRRGREPAPNRPQDQAWDRLELPVEALRERARADGGAQPGPAGLARQVGAFARRFVTQPAEGWLSFAIVLGAALFVFYTLHPGLIFTNNTPTGGDMGAHVIGPMYMIRHLLPHGEIVGWTPDWFAGFPLYQFYMVIPALAIVILHVGVRSWLLLPALVGSGLVALTGWLVKPLFRARKVLIGLGLLLVALSVPIPYGIAFKLITALGLVTLPISAWAFGKLCDLRFPLPPLFAMAAVLFIFNREPSYQGIGNIVGGNLTSTMAGEYSFAISLSLALVYFGVLHRGLRTGRHRALAAGLLALVGLCHLLPFFFALAATLVMLVCHWGWRKIRWLVPMGITAGLLASFWMVPFYLRHKLTNDMGWEKLPYANSGWHLFAFSAPNFLKPASLNWVFGLAVLGAVVAVVYRNRAGLFLTGCVLVTAIAFMTIPQLQLWNARILPFYYVSLYLLAAFGVGGLLWALSTLLAWRPDQPIRFIAAVPVGLAMLAVLIYVALPLQILPGRSTRTVTRTVKGQATQVVQFHWLGLSTTDRNDGSSWARWNYTGYEGKTAYPEYEGIVATMAKLGADPAHGCGRALWEEDNDRENSYGTPMALMLLPYWTNSCVTSMEGLYFESSSTTPYHFLLASEASSKPSDPQRDLPYAGMNLAAAVKHMQLLGVKYYMADTDATKNAASTQPDLTLVATSGPWEVYQVNDSPLVVGLSHLPAVWDVGPGQSQWLTPSVEWWNDPTRWDVPFAASGPSSWPRVKIDRKAIEPKAAAGDKSMFGTAFGVPSKLPRPDTPTVRPAEVSNVHLGTDRVSFDVDKPGTPVLVKVSYFPNWSVSGGTGPYRVTPNLMVVVPTSTHVELHYGRTSVDWLGWLMTLLGLIAVVWFANRAAPAMGPTRWWAASADRRRAAREERVAQRRAAREAAHEPIVSTPPVDESDPIEAGSEHGPEPATEGPAAPGSDDSTL